MQIKERVKNLNEANDIFKKLLQAYSSNDEFSNAETVIYILQQISNLLNDYRTPER